MHPHEAPPKITGVMMLKAFGAGFILFLIGYGMMAGIGLCLGL